MKFGIGQSVPRSEDPRLITGQGEYTDDINRLNQLYLRVLRSPYTHVHITELDITDALISPRVKTIDLAKDISHLGILPCRALLKDAQGNDVFIPDRRILAEDKALFVDQAIVAVIVDSPEHAENTVEAFVLSVDDLPACADPSRALDPDTQPLHGAQKSNLCVHFENSEGHLEYEALAVSMHKVVIDLVNNLVAPGPLEPRACLAKHARVGCLRLIFGQRAAVLLRTELFNSSND